MRGYSGRVQGRRSFGSVAVIGLLITFVGLGTVGVLATTGLVRFPWQHRKIEPVAPGMVRVWEAPAGFRPLRVSPGKIWLTRRPVSANPGRSRRQGSSGCYPVD